MKFKELREANLTKMQIKKVHDKADDLPKNDFIKRYGKDGDSVRFATATKMVKKELGIEDYEEGFKSDAQRKAAFASGYKEKGKKKNEELDDKDKETIKPIIKQLQKSVKAHDKQAKQLQKDIQDEVELDEMNFDRMLGVKGRTTGRTTTKSDNKDRPFKFTPLQQNKIYNAAASEKGNLEKMKKAIYMLSFINRGNADDPFIQKVLKTYTEEVKLDEVHFSNRGEPPAPKGMHKLRSGRDIPSTSKVDAIHKKVVAMTDRNDHSGARIEIAKACGDKQLVQIFSTLELIHDKYSGAVGNQSIELRGKMMNPLNKAIERKFGKYADVIQDAL